MGFKTGQEFVNHLVSKYCPEPSVVNSTCLTVYFTKAHDLYNKGQKFLQQEKIRRGYVELMRFAQLVLKLQEHNLYNDDRYETHRKLNKKRLQNAIEKLEELKPKIIANYNNQIKLQQQQQNSLITTVEKKQEKNEKLKEDKRESNESKFKTRNKKWPRRTIQRQKIAVSANTTNRSSSDFNYNIDRVGKRDGGIYVCLQICSNLDACILHVERIDVFFCCFDFVLCHD